MGNIIVDDKGCYEKIEWQHEGKTVYTLKLLIPKEVFIECYEKWILNKKDKHATD